MKSITLLLVLAAGCGSVKGMATPDAAKSADANTVDADESGMLSVVTQTRGPGGAGVGSAQGMVDVVSLAGDGTLEDMVQTDATGHAMVKAYPGGTVTAIYRHTTDMGADLATFMGVKPGDNLTFGSYWTSNDNTNLGTMNLSWPAFPGATFYEVSTPCIFEQGFPSTTTGNPFSEQTSCHHDPMGVVTAAFNGSGLAALGFSLVNFQSGGSSGLAGWQTVSNATNVTANISGLPPEVTSVGFQMEAVANGGRPIFIEGSNGQATGGAATLTVPWASIGDRAFSEVFLSRPGQYASIVVMDSLNASARGTTVAAPQLPPWITARIGSAAARMAVWIPVGPATHDGNVALINWSHTNMGTTSSYSWTFITPPDTTAITFPTLPSQFDDTQPHPEDPSGFQVHLLELPSVNGYDELRKQPEAVIACPSCAVASSVIPRAIVSD